MRYFRSACPPVLLLALMFSICAAVVYAQSDTAQISGFVKDSSEAVVPGTTVIVTNETTGLTRTVVTNDSGYYVVPTMPPGLYTVTAEFPGFKRFVSSNNKLDAAIPLTIDAILELGDVTETIEVVAQAGGVQTETATVGRTVEKQQIDKMILNGRNPVLLALLKPGVRRNASMASFNFTMTSGGYSINGSRTQDNLITHDGAVATRTRANGTAIGAVDVDQVQEIQILTANFKAEYGRSSGGQIRIITKGGQRDFHGNFYEFFRNNELDANDWRRNAGGQDREAQKFNQFGYNISGPAFIPGMLNTAKNKLFFSWGQEWARRRREQSSFQTVPSLAMRGGDFSALLGPNPFFSNVEVVNDPNTGQPFANNIIPSSRLSSNGTGLLRSYPEPTPGFLIGNDNFFQTRPRPTNQRKETIGIDFNPTDRHSYRFRFQNYNFTRLDAFRGGFDRSVTDWDRPNKTASLNYIWTASPTVVNEFLATASVDRVFIEIQREGLRFDRGKFGIDYPYVFDDPKEIDIKIPTTAIAGGFSQIDGGPYPASSTGPVYQIANNLSVVRGNHTFKFGAMWSKQGQNDFDQINTSGVPGGTNNQNGRFAFTDGRSGGSGLAVANAALGLYTTYAEIGTRASTPYRSTQISYFVQDSWRASGRLTVELGYRHMFVTPYYTSVWRNMAAFDPSRYDPSRAVVQDPSTGNVISGDRFNGVFIPGKSWPDAARGRVAIADSGEFDHLFSGGNNYVGQYQKGNIMPRVGLAYKITSKTVIRAGGGRFFSRPGVADNIFLGGNPPFQPMASLSNGLVDNPGGGGLTAFPQFFMTMDPVYKIPEAWNWNVAVQREIGFNTTVEVSYVGRAGIHMERVRELNALPIGTRNDPANDGINTNFLRPFKGFAFLNLGENAARSEYNSLQLDVTRRFTSGLSYGIAYTFSKSEDNASGRRDSIWNPFDDSMFWGPSDFDTRHAAVVNWVWEIPFLRDNNSLAGKLVGGWQLSGVAQFQTGRRRSVTRGNDVAGIGSGNAAQPWNLTGDPDLSRGDRKFSEGASDSNFYFDPAVFSEPAAGTFASGQPRNSLTSPGFQNWNVGVFKVFGITEAQKLTFRAEFFNLPNHPAFTEPQRNPTSATFGKVTGKDSERNIQLSLRYSF